MFWEKIIAEVTENPEFYTLIVTVLIVFINHFIKNLSCVIRRKTKAEVIQKLELESIIEIIDETKALRLAVEKLDSAMFFIKAEYEGEYANTTFDVISINKEVREKVKNFIFLLERDIIISGKKAKTEEEIIKKLENSYYEICNLFSNKANLPAHYEEITKVEYDQKESSYIEALCYFHNNMGDNIFDSINKILKIYKAKLN